MEIEFSHCLLQLYVIGVPRNCITNKYQMAYTIHASRTVAADISYLSAATVRKNDGTDWFMNSKWQRGGNESAKIMFWGRNCVRQGIRDDTPSESPTCRCPQEAGDDG